MNNVVKILIPVVAALAIGFFIGKFSGRGPDESKMTFAIYKGGEVKGAEVLEKVQNDLIQLEKNKYEIKRRATEEIIRARLQGAETPKPEDLDFKSQDISAEELAKFLKDRNLVEAKLSKLDRDNILNNMKLQKLLEARNKKLKEQTDQAGIVYKIPRQPGRTASISKGSMQGRGPSGSSVTVIQVANFHCPFCPQAESRLSELIEKYPGKIRTVYRFSLREPEASVVFKSAEASFCANDQDKFWAFHDVLVKKPANDVAELSARAEEAQLDMTKFQTCLSSKKHVNSVKKDSEEMEKVGIFAPSFVINGEVVAGQSSMTELQLIVDGELN